MAQGPEGGGGGEEADGAPRRATLLPHPQGQGGWHGKLSPPPPPQLHRHINKKNFPAMKALSYIIVETLYSYDIIISWRPRLGVNSFVHNISCQKCASRTLSQITSPYKAMALTPNRHDGAMTSMHKVY